MGVRPRVDELSVDANTIRRALHTSFDNMRDAELLPDLSKIAIARRFVAHHARAADHFEVGHFREIGQDFVLHAVGEVGILLVIAQIFERQHRDAFFRHGERLGF